MQYKLAELEVANSIRALYVSIEEHQSFPDAEAVIKHLRESGPRPLLLARRLRSPGVTVELEVLGLRPSIRLYLSPKPNEEKQQIEGIVAGIRSLKIDASLSA